MNVGGLYVLPSAKACCNASCRAANNHLMALAQYISGRALQNMIKATAGTSDLASQL